MSFPQAHRTGSAAALPNLFWGAILQGALTCAHLMNWLTVWQGRNKGPEAALLSGPQALKSSVADPFPWSPVGEREDGVFDPISAGRQDPLLVNPQERNVRICLWARM